MRLARVSSVSFACCNSRSERDLFVVQALRDRVVSLGFVRAFLLQSADFGVSLFHQPIAFGNQAVQFPNPGDVEIDASRACGTKKILEGALFLVQALRDRVVGLGFGRAFFLHVR